MYDIMSVFMQLLALRFHCCQPVCTDTVCPDVCNVICTPMFFRVAVAVRDYILC